MTAAITLFVVLTISVTVIRVAAVALRLTGLAEDTARFQARSAFTGAGYTTTEAEVVVNHPVRRRIVSLLMVLGNLGLVSVLATVIVSLVESPGSTGIVAQLLWLAAVLVVLWFVALNPLADRIMCGAIGRLIGNHSMFAAAGPTTLLQLPAGHGVFQLRIDAQIPVAGGALDRLAEGGVVLLGLHRADGSYLAAPAPTERLAPGDALILHGQEPAIRRLIDRSEAST